MLDLHEKLKDIHFIRCFRVKVRKAYISIRENIKRQNEVQ